MSRTVPYEAPGLNLPSISLPQTEPDVTEPTFGDFTGGWNTEDFPDNIDDKDALEIENFIWSKTGGLEPRPGYAFYNDTEIESGEHIWGLYPLYTIDGNKTILVGTNGTLWADTNEAGTVDVSVKTGLQSNSKYYEFETFKGKAIVVHEGDYPFILDDTTEITATGFGFVDSIVWKGRHGSACTTFVTAEDVDWQANQWAGFFLCTSLYPFTAARIILSNTADELAMGSTLSDAILVWSSYRYIFGFFDYDSIASGTLDSAELTACSHKLYDESWTESWEDGTYVIKMTSGGSQGQERGINNISGTWLESEYPFEDNLEADDSYIILNKVFWKPRLCEVYKNRVFFVTENEYPSSGKEFIVFSEYNNLTYFGKDNFFTVKSGDGSKITALATFYQDQLGYKDNARDGLVIFKENSIFILTFIDATNYYLTQVIEGVGCMAGQTVQVIENKYMLFLHSTGVYAFDGRTVTLLTKKIDSEIEDIERRIDHDKYVAGYDDRHYHLSGPGFYDATYPAGGFIVAFEMDSAAEKDGYWTHNFDSTGNETGDDNWEFYESAGNYVDIAAKPDGEYAIMFKKSSGGTGWKVFLAFFDEDGVQIGDTLRIDDGGISTGYANNDDHKLDMNSAGQIIACWTDKSDGNNDIQCQGVDFDEGLVGKNFYANSDSGDNTEDYVSWGVGINEEGICVVVWQDLRDNLTVLSEIYAQRFQYPDTALGANFRVSSGVGAHNENKPAVAVGPRTFVVSWISSDCTGAVCLYKRAYNIDGTARESEHSVSDCAGGNVQEPSIEINSRGNYVVAYDKECTENSYSIFMTVFDSTDGVHLAETQVCPHDSLAQGPDVAINNDGIIVVVWYDGYYDANVEIGYRSYDWDGNLVSPDSILSSSAYCQYPEIDCLLSSPDTTTYALAWNIDYGGWSKMVNFGAGLYATQKGLTDTINMIFSDPANRSYVYEFGKVFQDTGQDISVLFKSKAFDFNSISNQKRVTRFFLNYYLDEGNFDLTFYTDFGDTSRYTSSVSTSGGYRYVRVPLDWTCRGRNFSYKIESTDDLRIDKIRLRLKIEED